MTSMNLTKILSKIFFLKREKERLNEKNNENNPFYEKNIKKCSELFTMKKIDKYILDKRIGKGSFGEIYKATNSITNEKVAIKIVKHISNTSLPDKENEKIERFLLKHEAQLYNLFKQYNLKKQPRLRGYGIQNPEHIQYMVIDLMDMSLEKWVNKQLKKNSLKNRRKKIFTNICLQMIESIEELHNIDYIHRDIKPDNFVIKKNGKKLSLYLIDYGLCKHHKYDLGSDPTNQKEETSSGNIFYKSIHVVNKWKHSRRDDLISIGYLMFFIYHGKALYQLSDTDLIKWKKDVLYFPKETTTYMEYEISSIIIKYFSYCSTLDFNTKPNYSYIKKIFLV